MAPNTKKERKAAEEHAQKVFMYVPNLIGYARVLLNIACCFTFFSHYVLTFWMYLTSFVLDLFDGYYARKLKQCSKLGIVLDMVTDRTGTAIFLLGLSHHYQQWVPLWASLLMLDIISHWMQMYSSVVAGHASHKDTQASQFFLLRLYYSPHKYFFGYCCIGAEVFYMSLYMWANAKGMIIYGDMGFYELVFWICLPGWAFKQVVNVVQTVNAAYDLAELPDDS